MGGPQSDNERLNQPPERILSDRKVASVAASPAQVVGDWAGEARDYDYRSNSCRDVCGHYTQVVWRATREATGSCN